MLAVGTGDTKVSKMAFEQSFNKYFNEKKKACIKLPLFARHGTKHQQALSWK